MYFKRETLYQSNKMNRKLQAEYHQFLSIFHARRFRCTVAYAFLNELLIFDQLSFKYFFKFCNKQNPVDKNGLFSLNCQQLHLTIQLKTLFSRQ